MFKYLTDTLFSLIAVIVLLPMILVITLIIWVEGGGCIIFKQQRVGKINQLFTLYKFRTMNPKSESGGLLTVGGRDKRITKSGYYLRKYKLDELPQLFNIIKGDMSIVGPRPEVEKYVALYSDEQMKVLEVKPGLSDYASLEYINENEILSQSLDPEKTYIEEIMPAKLRLNLKYIEDQSFLVDMKIITKTILKILS
ncbi:MAG: sugar transferase [Bacteroidales bacterium]|nr:sugar transferase [Bacteroidales bacterium]